MINTLCNFTFCSFYRSFSLSFRAHKHRTFMRVHIWLFGQHKKTWLGSSRVSIFRCFKLENFSITKLTARQCHHLYCNLHWISETWQKLFPKKNVKIFNLNCSPHQKLFHVAFEFTTRLSYSTHWIKTLKLLFTLILTKISWRTLTLAFNYVRTFSVDSTFLCFPLRDWNLATDWQQMANAVILRRVLIK